MSAFPPILVTFIANGDTNAVGALRRVLKFALRECGLRAIDAHPIFEATSPDLPAQLSKYSANTPHRSSAAAVENAREAARRCLRTEIRWDNKEKNFLNEATRLDTFSERQLEWLRALYRRTKPRAGVVPLHRGVNNQSAIRDRGYRTKYRKLSAGDGAASGKEASAPER